MHTTRLAGALLLIGAAACSADSSVVAPESRAGYALAGNGLAGNAAANGEGAEASARAHLDLRAVRAELLATDRTYAAAALTTNLVEALVAPLADDAVFLAPGATFARGPEEARAVLLTNPNNVLSRWSWTAIRVDVSSDGTQGYTYGYTELTLPSGAVLPGKYQAYWERQADGAWKVAAYKRSPRGAGDVSLTPPAGFATPDTKHRRYFPNTDPASEIAAIEATDRAFSDLAQVVSVGDAFAHYAAPDGAQTGGGLASWAFGPAAIAAAHDGEEAGLFSWSPVIADVAPSGDLGFTVGLVYQEGAVVGKYFTVWQKQNDGEWRFVVD